MRGGIFRTVRVHIILVSVIATAAVLISTIFFTRDNLPWVAFLTGILAASVLAEAARASRSEWMLMRRTTQLSSMKEKFEFEVRQRKSAEENNAGSQARLQLVDEKLLTIIVLIDIDGYCRYHNRAFRELSRLKAEQIDGQHMRALFGPKAYASIATAVRQSLDGQSVHYEHVQEMSGGAAYRLLVEHHPQFNAVGHVTGFYFLAEDITGRGDLHHSRQFESARKSTFEIKSGMNKHVDQNSLSETRSRQASEPQDEEKQFIEAVQGGEFRLYCQLISPLPIDSGKTAHYEILIRLAEEEGGIIPPGAFFPLAEKSGLMPYLDRWVVQHVLAWAAKQQNFRRDSDSIFFIHVAAATIGDPEFPCFLQGMLLEHGMPGSVLCFEVSGSALAARNNSVAEFVRQVRECGCRVALSGFGRNAVSFDQIRGFQVDFLKIDGGTILNMLSNPLDLARVISIDRIAKKIGVKTVAELVESDEIVAKLIEVGIDFSQGSGIASPRCLAE